MQPLPEGLPPINDGIACGKIRINIPKDLLTHYDDGRSKSLYCISCALLPVDQLVESHRFANSLNNKDIELKEKTKLVKRYLSKIADKMNTTLKLNKSRAKY